MVTEGTKKQKSFLEKELSGKFVHLKVDACIRVRVNYFAINIHYFAKDGTVITTTLSVTDTRNQHASVVLQKLVLDVLNDFEIEKKRLYVLLTTMHPA